MRVCLICEGCYPYVPGGVSGWIQMLCSEFREVDFVIWSIATTREEMPEAVYEMPMNVKELRTCYLGQDCAVPKRKGRSEGADDSACTGNGLVRCFGAGQEVPAAHE